MKKKLIGLIILLLVAAAIFGILYLTTDLFKTPDQLFFKHFIKDVMGNITYEEMLSEIKNTKELSMETEGEITGNITSKTEDIRQLSKIIGKGKIIYNTKTIGTEQKMQQNIKLNYNDKNIVDLELLKNGEQYGIKVDELYDKYISVENNNLKATFEKLGMDTSGIPDRITALDYYELLNIDEKSLNHIKITYYNVLKENIPIEAYSVEKDITIKIDNNDVMTNAYKLTLTADQLATIEVKMLETLKNDEKVLGIISQKSKLLKDCSINEKEFNKEEIIKLIDEEIKKIQETMGQEYRTFSVTVYETIDEKSKIDIVEKYEEKENSKLEIATIKTENDMKYVISAFNQDVKIDVELLENDVKSNAVIKIDNRETVVEINIKEEVRATENISIENFESSNSVKLNDMTETEIQQLAGKIYLKAMYVLPQKIYLLGINFNDLFSLQEESNVENEIIEQTTTI